MEPELSPREEIDRLKADWQRDPCWDLNTLFAADDPEYGPFVQELIDFQAAQEARWAADKERRLSEKAVELGCPGNTKLAAYIERLEHQIESLSEKLEKHTNAILTRAHRTI